MQGTRSALLFTFLCGAIVAIIPAGEVWAVERPFILWNKKDMAAALQEEKLIRRVWAAYGSWKWYFDEYLCDIGFYSEEFGKMGSTPGAILLYCRALERLGDNHEQPLMLGGGKESFTFADWAYVRVGKDKVEVWGKLQAMKLRIAGRPKLVINGDECKAMVAGGYLSYGRSAP